MSATISITVEDIETVIDTYNSIQIYRGSSAGGSYSLLTTVALVDDSVYYSYIDTTGSLNYWYIYRFYHSGTSAYTSYSNPFRPVGLTLLKIRQFMLSKYRLGLTLIATTGGDTNTVVTADSRVKTTRYPTGRGEGNVINPTSGNEAGNSRLIVSSIPSSGSFDVSPAWSVGLADQDEFEWHWLSDPQTINDAINRGLRRYWYIDRVPMVGDENLDDYPLTFIPWLEEEKSVSGVFWFPNALLSDTPASNLQRPFGQDGHWWGVRQDGGAITLSVSPRIDADTTLYIEAYRRMPELFTDASVAPANCNIELAAALGYDELLSYFTNPVFATVEEQASYGRARQQLRPSLRALLRLHKARPRYGPAQLTSPTSYRPPYTPR